MGNAPANPSTSFFNSSIFLMVCSSFSKNSLKSFNLSVLDLTSDAIPTALSKSKITRSKSASSKPRDVRAGAPVRKKLALLL